MTESTVEVTSTVETGPQDRVDKVRRLVQIAVEAELHAFALLLGGIWLTISGHKDEGLLVLGGAMGIFKGNK